MTWEDYVREDGLPGGKTCQMSSTIFLLSSIFPRTIDVAPGVGFWWSQCPWKSCDVFFGVSQISREVELGPVRYNLANKGRRSVFPWRRVIFRLRFQPDREAFGYPRVTRCSWTCPIPWSFKLSGQLVVSWKDSVHECRLVMGLFFVTNT